MSSIEDRLARALAITAGAVQEDRLHPLESPEPPRRRRWPLMLAPLAAAMAVVLIVGIEVTIGRMTAGQPASGSAPAAATVSVGKYPDAMVFDAADKTIYVLNQGSKTLTMVGTATCDASTTRGCGQVRQAPAGAAYAQDIAVNPLTRTIYLLSGFRRSTVAVINAATCNAATTSGCSSRALIHIPPHAVELAVNPRTGSIYVFYNALARMSVINGRACNASDVTGCARAVATAPAPAADDMPGVAIDPATNTVYYGAGDKLAVIDGRVCGAGDVSGCGKPVAVAPVAGAGGLAIDQATGTLYATGGAHMMVTVVNRNTCDALTTTGCDGPLHVIRGGPLPTDVADDPAARTVYVTGGGPGGVTMINVSACRAGDLNGCPRLPSRFPAGGAAPGQLVADPASHTLYVANTQNGTLSIINTAACDAAETSGCPRWSSGTASPSPAGRLRQPCDYVTGRYDSGLPAAPLLKGSVRVAAGSVDGMPWSLWAKKGAAAPYGIEQGGLVLGGHWYGLCAQPFLGGQSSAFPANELALIGTRSRGVAYGFVQDRRRVRISLSSGTGTWSPSTVRMKGLTFYISRLPRPACSYQTMTAHFAVRKPLSSGHATVNIGACAPGWLVVQRGGGGSWGPGPGN